MRNLSRENLRTFQKEPAVPRTLTGEKPVGASLKQSQIRIGKYKYDPKDELGRGYSGNVFKGVEILKQHKRYAIKVVNLKKFKGSNLEMLEGQIQIHRNLDHENIVKLHEVIKTTQHYYLIMQYCPHGNLTEYIAQKKQLSESNALEILNQLISAYKHLLSEGIIHRDIKPANILRVGNKWKISDFGFSARSRFGFKDRMNVGTPLYMAPESLKKNYYSYKSDLFSIGIVLYEMLMGQTPHEASTEKELFEKVSHQIVLPRILKNSKILQFLNKCCLISEAKRMNRDQFQNFDFGTPSVSALGSHSNSCSMLSYKDRKSSSDESALKHNIATLTDLSTKFHHHRDISSKQCSKEVSREASLSSKHVHFNAEQSPKPVVNKNPMIANKDILQQQFEFVQHFYYTIKNIDSFHLDQNTRSMFMLGLFKLLLKLMRLLCDKNQNYLQLNNWEEYQQCKLHQQLYSEFTLFSERYQKEYLEFIKHNDIKVIRAVNRKFPQLCNNAPLTSKFYQNFKHFITGVIRQHETEVSSLVEQGQEVLNDRFAALESIYKIHKLSDLRSNSPFSSLMGQKPILLEDYSSSKLTKNNYNNLKRLVKNI